MHYIPYIAVTKQIPKRCVPYNETKIEMNNTFKSILKYLIEIVIVAFGVFLGVYYSNVNADNQTKNEKNKSISLIISELEHNKELLEEHIAYHKKIKIEIDSIIPSLSEDELYLDFARSELNHLEIKGWKGFRFARLQKTAFESAKTSGIIKEYNIELIQKISEVYSFQDMYIDFGTSILDKAIGIDSSMKLMDFLGTAELMTSDLLGTEIVLLGKLEKNIIELKTTHNNGS